MNDSIQSNDDDNLSSPEAELAALKERAKLLGIPFSNNIGLDTLRKKVNAAVNDEDNDDDDEQPVKVATEPKIKEGGAPHNETVMQRRARINSEAMALVRVRISNMNPEKAAWPGEWVGVVSKYTGSVRKYIPFGEATDGGYHIPKIIYDELIERKFQQIRVTKDAKGNEKVTTRMVREYQVTILEPLTEAELKELAAAQQAAARVNGE